MKIGERIKQIRKEKGMTHREVTALSGMSNSDQSLIENGKKDIRVDTLIKYANALKVYPFRFLVGVTELTRKEKE